MGLAESRAWPCSRAWGLPTPFPAERYGVSLAWACSSPRENHNSCSHTNICRLMSPYYVHFLHFIPFETPALSGGSYC